MKKTLLKIAACISVVVLLAATLPLSALAARSLTDIDSEIKEQEQRMAELEKQISANKNNKAAYEASLAEYEVEYTKVLGLIEEKEAVIASTGEELDAKSEELNDTRESIDRNQALFEKRLLAIADINSTGAVMGTLLSVNSFSEFIQAADAVKRISSRDTELLQELANQRERYARQKAELEDTIATLNAQYEELQGQRDYFYTKAQEMRTNIANAEWAITEGEQAYEESEEKAAELKAEYARIFAESQRKGSQKGDGSVRWDGPLKWPVPGNTRISSWYGDYRSNTRGHYGIDIPAAEGTPITAAASGTVITSEWHYSYGYYIVMDHGDGLRTLYAHCVQLYKGVGSYVSAGEAIAGVGNTGNSFGAHLHFEVHDNGARQNPIGSGYLSA
ncbi:MAG: peptidoglycan DD-metalloendopeptidase family protein [Ruminococcaceae bacterium]|nr:peptidoglycan DD-metalloendopeptidase family protein [Oscillospiraceae bacterium]